MVAGKVRKIMVKALKNLSEIEKVKGDEIQLMIHASGECEFEHGKLDILYFYCVNNVPKKNEDGRLKHLHFTHDILLKSFDVQMFGMISKNFLRKKLEEEAKVVNQDPKTLIIVIQGIDENIDDVTLSVFNTVTKKTIKTSTLEEVFPD